ncbi:cytochrome P450 [Aquabacterium sp. OR-4]|uniref:cytochrome P450 n=1 Tax=Aquabacterium sp. OR-4 TaxID=2978127 RepID=UPI0021B25B64|nr:cytochrome P450 [Aquabacterium sp. OR-4]MDT7835652.1 cytochrome P450 [Aquabacterium sp. OR-4]
MTALPYHAIPLVKGLPLVGNLPKFLRDPLAHAQGLAEHGPVVRSRTFFETVTLLGPEANQFVLHDREGNFSSRDGWSYWIDAVFPGAIMAMDDPQHRHHRRIMQGAFKRQAMARYVQDMGPVIAAAVDAWPAGRLPVFAQLKALTLNIAARVFMGLALGAEADRMNQAFVDTVAASLALVRRPLPPLAMWRGVRARRWLVGLMRSKIADKRATETPDLFSQLCHARSEDGEAFSDDEVVDHMIFLMMAAHDTTTSALTTMFYCLAREPDWQQRLRADALALEHDQLTLDDLPGRERTEWVMKEALRLYPPLTSIPRRAARDCEFGGYRIPRGTPVGVSPIHTHHMPELWTAPTRFDPERFAPARAEHKRHAYAYLPFGGGAHLCIGQHFADMEVKAVMHRVLRRWRWQVPAGYRMPYQLVPIARPRDGLPITLQPL